VGGGIDAGITLKWLTHLGAPMESTVHLAFTATTSLVLGLNIICSSFLLNMILGDTSTDRTEAEHPGAGADGPRT